MIINVGQLNGQRRSADGTTLLLSLLLTGGCVAETFPVVHTLALGDSVTGDYSSSTYPQFLITELDIEADEFAPEGSGGRTAAAGASRLQQIVDLEIYPNVEVFIYFLGGADIVDFIASHDPGLAVAPSEDVYPFTEELTALLADLRVNMTESLDLASRQGWRVFVATYQDLPAEVSPCLLSGSALSEIEASRANEYVHMLNQLVTELAVDLELTLVDLQLDDEELMSDPDNYADCLHPGRGGAQIIARRFAEVLASAK